MRKTTLVLTLVAMAPLATAATMTWTDPEGDEATFIGTRLGAKACHHAATDITRVEADVQGSRLTVLLSVLNGSGAWDCRDGTVLIPAHSGSQVVAFQNCGAACGSALTLQRTWETSATGEMRAEQCYVVGNSIPMGCQTTTIPANVSAWTIPLKTSVYDLRSKCFATAFAESRSAPSVPQAATLLETKDSLDLGPTCF